jgi:hypothetical protein
MKRRRLIVAIAVLTFAIAGVSWLTLDPLSAEERRLVGTWQLTGGGPGAETLIFTPDRRVTTIFYRSTADGQSEEWLRTEESWAVRDGWYGSDGEPSRLKRAFRPVARFVGQPVNLHSRSRLEWAGDEVRFVPEGSKDPGSGSVWRRVPMD